MSVSHLTSPNIMYEDESILIVDKPVGLTVNNSHTSYGDTVQNWASRYFSEKGIFNGIIGSEINEFGRRGGIVHRLDKDTSGVLVIAKNSDTFNLLQAQFKQRLVKKEYIAIVFGFILEDIIEIDAPLARSSKYRLKRAVSKSGKEAYTRIERIKNFEYKSEKLSYLRVFPLTGRTHQIRIHLAAIGHPVVGDSLYANKKQIDWAYKDTKINRMLLHAKKICLHYPGENDVTCFESQLPSKFTLD